MTSFCRLLVAELLRNSARISVGFRFEALVNLVRRTSSPSLPNESRNYATDWKSVVPTSGNVMQLILTVLLVATCSASNLLAEQGVPGKQKFFEDRIRPLLVKHCYECHGAEVAEGKLRLDTKNGWERGGERGPAIVPGDPSASLLIRAISYRDEKLLMPPKDSGGKLSTADIDALTNWIRQGAHDPRVGQKVVTNIEKAAAQHWAFQPLAVQKVEDGLHPLDALIDRKLREHNMVATEPADARTLIRRMTFDLLGLPPTAEEVDAFVAESLRDSAPSHGVTRPHVKRPASAESSIRRTLGAALAGCRSVLGREGRRLDVWRRASSPLRLHLSRLCHPRVQRR